MTEGAKLMVLCEESHDLQMINFEKIDLRLLNTRRLVLKKTVFLRGRVR